ncbi:acyl-CoA reductase-like NAD-dependent aldehyde dehydrogenase [Prauserella sediminis]|uniref:Acyl-CoA reductase-like NAD-dependent aldehyde dehydrogenase n=1 Tax=Prauserella sediminis TaxID=577680 RepID=A0A839XUI4_9PSEU|nr:acyl-CoA reductase-like NAD-dependent aldehyde dehydrogenase [Prauserella sediminis]
MTAEVRRHPVRGVQRDQPFVGGARADFLDGPRAVATDPADGAVVGEAQLAGPAATRRAATEAAATVPSRADASRAVRATFPRMAAEYLEADVDVVADTASSETGARRTCTGGVALPNVVRYRADLPAADNGLELRPAGSGRVSVNGAGTRSTRRSAGSGSRGRAGRWGLRRRRAVGSCGPSPSSCERVVR